MNENTPNFNGLLRTADNILGTWMSGLGCFTILFFLAWPFVAIIYLIGVYVFGLPD
ncbi:hypothetical protein HFP89_08030 [Wenzhouxiangella sp. XN79A]|uniref:hypothetical protein n=1 Tax=Wenzhouxiangella sp. XN79A TaxID=2724193 RepID=UPI00144AEB74|nr:hypothetical protein [Wenzhouxiangella sp. XN79A]NKI35112.1 hypothetical protein [Wenzhouxiangella sp. XN79A]